jgi:hypothetical protein
MVKNRMPQMASWLRKNLLLLATFSGQSFSPPYTVKKVLRFSRFPGMPARESLVSDIPAGEGKMLTFFTVYLLRNSIFLACKRSDLNKNKK